jgi:hypothetical protein
MALGIPGSPDGGAAQESGQGGESPISLSVPEVQPGHEVNPSRSSRSPTQGTLSPRPFLPSWGQSPLPSHCLHRMSQGGNGPSQTTAALLKPKMTSCLAWCCPSFYQPWLGLRLPTPWSPQHGGGGAVTPYKLVGTIGICQTPRPESFPGILHSCPTALAVWGTT